MTSTETTPPARPSDVDQPLCPNCLAVNEADAHFCQACQAPLTAHAATDPLRGVFAMGHVVGKAASRPRSRVVLVGLWLIVGPAFLLNLQALWYATLALVYPLFRFRGWHVPDYSFVTQLFAFLLALGVEVLFAAILVKVTWNYWRGAG